MPHFVLSYYPDAAKGCDTDRLMQVALEVGAHSGIMQKEDIKVRLERSKDILFGDARRSYIHVEVALMAGRTQEAKLAFSTAMVGALRAEFPQVASITCEMRDMERESYAKSLA